MIVMKTFSSVFDPIPQHSPFLVWRQGLPFTRKLPLDKEAPLPACVGRGHFVQTSLMGKGQV
jgi:hypothetical protein